MIHSSNSLTCGERAVRCLLGEQIDHVPFGVSLGWEPWGETVERWRRESGDPGLVPREFFGFEGSFAIPEMHSGIFPAFEEKVLEEDDRLITWTDSRGITQRNRKDGASIPEYLAYPVKSPSDWERLKEEIKRLCFAPQWR